MILPESLYDLKGGDIIELDDITQLSAFEDLVAEQIDPAMPPSIRNAWAGRVAVKDLIRPRGHNGPITDIRLTVMDKPYTRLFDARDRGWKFSSGQPMPHQRSTDSDVINSYQGYNLSGNGKSTGRGIVAQIRAELYYGSVTFNTSSYTTKSNERVIRRYKRYAEHAGASIQRYVAKPKKEVTAFMELDQVARKIGFTVLQQNMRHPIIQPIRE